MRFFIAAPWPCKEEANEVAQQLFNRGHYITSHWHADKEDSQLHGAWRNLQDIDAADALIILTERAPESHGGMFAELGYAIAKNKRIFRHGPNWCIYDRLGSTEWDK